MSRNLHLTIPSGCAQIPPCLQGSQIVSVCCTNQRSTSTFRTLGAGFAEACKYSNILRVGQEAISPGENWPAGHGSQNSQIITDRLYPVGHEPFWNLISVNGTKSMQSPVSTQYRTTNVVGFELRKTELSIIASEYKSLTVLLR